MKKEQLKSLDEKFKKLEALQSVYERIKKTHLLCLSCTYSDIIEPILYDILQNGCEWTSTGLKVKHVDCPFLLVNDDLKLKYADKNSYGVFENPNNVYISTDDILNIELETEEPKPKFDPNTLQPFDKVLVRDDMQDEWRIEFFDCYDLNESYPFCCACECYRQCVPYNEETKHLRRTTEEAPEFYQVWK